MQKEQPLKYQIVRFLSTFKVKPCLQNLEFSFKDQKSGKSHDEIDQSLCWYSHDKNDERRPLIIRDNYYEYAPILCPNINEKKCQKRNKCGYSHNIWEQILHPNFDIKNSQTNEQIISIFNKVIHKYFPALKTLNKFLVMAKQEIKNKFRFIHARRRVKSFNLPLQKDYVISFKMQNSHESYFWPITDQKNSDKQRKSSSFEENKSQKLFYILSDDAKKEPSKLDRLGAQMKQNFMGRDNLDKEKQIAYSSPDDLQISPTSPNAFQEINLQAKLLDKKVLSSNIPNPPPLPESMNQKINKPQNKSIQLTLSSLLPAFTLNDKIKLQNQIYEDDILKNFKTIKCEKNVQHNTKLCSYYHSPSDKRRSLKQYSYSSELCPNHSKNCLKEDQCLCSHNLVERLYHPTQYKTQLCKDSYQGRICNYQETCSFAHDNKELQIELLDEEQVTDHFILYKYKTVYCPYFQCNQKHSCPYAHNIQDFRRSPALYDYQPVQCPQWKTEDQTKFYYYGQCKDGKNCNKCHGWKELEYHQKVFRKKQCTTQNCSNSHCPYSHQIHNQMYQQFKPQYSQQQYGQNQWQNSYQYNPYQSGNYQQNQDQQGLFYFVKQPRQQLQVSRFQRPITVNQQNQINQYQRINQFQQQNLQENFITSPGLFAKQLLKFLGFQNQKSQSLPDQQNQLHQFLSTSSYRSRSGSFGSGEDNYSSPVNMTPNQQQSAGWSQFQSMNQYDIFSPQNQPVKVDFIPDYNPIQNIQKKVTKQQQFAQPNNQNLPKFFDEGELRSLVKKQQYSKVRQNSAKLFSDKDLPITFNRRFKTDSLHTTEETVLVRLFKKLRGTNLEYVIEKFQRSNVTNEQLINISFDDMTNYQITDPQHQVILQKTINELENNEETDRIINDNSLCNFWNLCLKFLGL